MNIDEKLKRMPRTIRVGIQAGGLSEFISIQDAIDYCDNEGGIWVIETHPGTYVEGDITPIGAADITIRGIGQDRVIIVPAVAPAVGVIVSNGDFSLENLTVISPDATRPALRIATGICDVDKCEINGDPAGNGIEQVGGVLHLEDVHIIGDILLNTAQCDLLVNGCRLVNGDLVTGGAFAHTILIEYLDFNLNNFNNLATGATVIEIRYCSQIGTFTDASLGGTVLIENTIIPAGGAIKNGTSPWTIELARISTLTNNNATGGIIVYGGYIHLCGGSTGSILWYLPDSRKWRCIANMNPVDFMAAIAAGDTIEFGAGTFALAAQLARAIDNVKLIGSGLGTRFTLDGVTPVITAGAQDGWILADFDVDAGLVNIAGATNSTLHNITVNGLHSTIINPDVGVTRFPGQPTLRVEEIRPLDPATTEIIKDYSRKEYQTYNPTFATPEFIMELLNRQARTQLVPINDVWIDNSAVGGTSTPFPQYMIVATPAAANAHGLAYCTAAFLTSSFSAGIWNRADFDNRIIVAFDMARPSGSHADLRARVQLKQVNTEGILAADGLGIEVQNLAIYGECYNAARSTVSLATTMTANYVYRIMIDLIPGVSVDFYVNDQYKTQITTVANIPSGLAAGQCYWVISIDNGAVATASEFVVSPILFHNHL